jgi:hypothetical protein
MPAAFSPLSTSAENALTILRMYAILIEERKGKLTAQYF